MRLGYQIVALLAIISIIFSIAPTTARSSSKRGHGFVAKSVLPSCLEGRRMPPWRANVASIADFGGVGDGATLNTEAFQRAIFHLTNLAKANRGGSQLVIPAGNWLTGCFALTSHFTLFLQKGATILASQNIGDWPLVKPLPSYGRGRERPGQRHCSFIHGYNLADVVITGENGTIDGQGWGWWDMWEKRTLEHTRGHLIEFVGSHDLVIHNVVLKNSPFWTVHPVYCRNMVVKGVTILAPGGAPNTDGIDPDSSTNVCIEDCYISTGDDMIALKSGWDEYGMAVGRPTANILIRRVTGTSPCCSGIAFGSEISGGITNVTIEDVHVFDSSAGVRLKTAPGRGAYISNISIRGMTMVNVATAFKFSVDSAEHPDENYNPNAFTTVSGISIQDVVGTQIKLAGRFMGSKESPFLDICLSRISLDASPFNSWTCTPFVHGSSSAVSPSPCPALLQDRTSSSAMCTPWHAKGKSMK